MKRNTLTFIACCLLLQACATNQRTPLPETENKSIKDLNLYPLVIQDEVKPSVEISNVAGAMGGGLIPALIDSSINKGRSKSSEEIIEPLYNATEDFDFRKVIGKEIDSSISSIYTVSTHKQSAEAILLSNPDIKKKVATLSEGQYLLFTSTFYGLMEDSKTLNVETVAFLFKNDTKKGSANTKPVYQNNISYISAPVGSGSSSSIALWSADNGKLFIDTLNESAKETAALLKYDIQNPEKFECNKGVTASIFGFNGVVLKTKSILVEEKSSRSSVRNAASGWLYSVPTSRMTQTNSKAKCK